MAKVYLLSEREHVIQLHGQGISMRQIASQTGMNYNTVQSIVKRYKSHGQAGFQLRYDQCGRKRTYESERSYRLVRLYKRYHPSWGVGYILMKIKEKYPDLPLCVSRVYERRLKVSHLLSMPRNPPMATVYRAERAILPHDVWQIDAKEQITTLDGQPACYLTITDEKTGGALEARVFPP